MSDVRSAASFCFVNRRGELHPAMTIEFSCPHCTRLVRTPDAAAGKKGKCPSCNGIVQIPAASSTPQPVGVGASTPAAPAKPTAPTKPTATKSAAPTKPPAAPTKPPAPASPPAEGPIEFFCSSCGQIVRTPRTAAGKKGKCPHCGEVVSIPQIEKPAAAVSKPVAAPQPDASAANEDRKRLAIESKKESTKSKPTKAISSAEPTAKPAATAAPAAAPALDRVGTVVMPVAPEVAAAVKASELATKTSAYFGDGDLFATLHQYDAPGLVKTTPQPAQVAAKQPAPTSAPQAPAQPAAAPAPKRAAPVATTAIVSQAPIGTGAFEPLCPMGPLPRVINGNLVEDATPAPASGSPFAPISLPGHPGPPFAPISIPGSGAVSIPTPVNDPFSELPLPSPFAAVVQRTALQSIMGAVHVPAIIQLIVIIPSLIAVVIYLGLNCIFGGLAAIDMTASDPQLKQFGSANFYSALTSGLLSIVVIFMQGFIIFGSIRQMQRRSWLLSLITNVLAAIPCISPMGLPSAIWSLVSLCQNEVKSSFR